MKDPYENNEKLRYKTPVISREAILDYLSNKTNGSGLKKFINGSESKAVVARIKAMVRDGQIIYKANKYYAAKSYIATGYIIIRQDGFGLVNVDNKDIIIVPRHVVGVVKGDLVKVRYSEKKLKNKLLGVLVDVIHRSSAHLLARIENNKAILSPGQMGGDGTLLLENSTKNQEQALVEIIKYPSIKSSGVCQLVKTIDKQNNICNIAALTHGMPYEFSDKVINEAEKLKMATIKGRKDLRNLPFVTIDGDDAKDFDDAVYVESRDKGWLLYVAIADVSHYVRQGSAIDQAAMERGVSAYFPGQVIPMLPEALSNDLCSLLPKQDRAVMVAELAIDKSGKLERTRLYKALINSFARFTYQQVTDFATAKTPVPGFWVEALDNLQSLCLVLNQKKQSRGALDINRKEQLISLDLSGNVNAVKLISSNIAQKFIELCMLEANEAVATFMIKNNLPGIYREHSKPKSDKLEELLLTIKNYGIVANDLDFQSIAKQISESEHSEILMLLLLRSLPQATYTHKKLGHFGLAYKNYCHFTSPIRRYADLWVHRVITSFIESGQALSDDFLSERAQYCSFAERRADIAAREVGQKYLCLYMQDKIGKEFSSKIISVHSFGFFVSLDNSGIEGLVHVSNLPKDQYVLYEASNSLVGQYLGMKYGLGDKIMVALKSINLQDGKLEFFLK